VVAAVHGGAGRVIAVGRMQGARLEAAEALGAIGIAAQEVDVVAAIRDLTEGAMADVIVDLAPGTPDTITTAVQLARKGGTIILTAAKHGKAVDLQGDLIVRNELTVKGVRGRDYASVEEALEIIQSDRYPLQRLRTHDFPLDRADEALRVQGERTDPSAIHVTVVP
jgi:threonine dehydrogenase-like Zn-dependent dehydrogenase